MMEKVMNTSPCLLQAGQPLKTGGAVPVRNKKNTGTFNNDDWKKKKVSAYKIQMAGFYTFLSDTLYPVIHYLRKEQLLDYYLNPPS